jgi:lipopolysaccharide transport system ATP-binding protein
MSRPIITCEKLSKSYRLGTRQQGIGQFGNPFTLRHTVSDTFHSALRYLKGSKQEASQEDSLFWALRDVSFDVRRGEVVGIIGRNGAGKSTLLKILSRIVEPTHGVARLRGRVASLLEVGTGFHPELTGRENIYLNGAMLGMRKAEITRKLVEIIAFSEIEEFLDTPVKRYSSGMYVRLAFAVAAHLEPEILIVDEVLAVGDHGFQKKCMGKMRDVASGDGRTILFVSHNMGALAQLCERCVLLEQGQVTMIGPVGDVVKAYLKAGLNHNTAQVRFPLDPALPCQFITVAVVHSDGNLGSDFSCDEPVKIRMQLLVREPEPGTILAFGIDNLEGTRVVYSDVRDTDPSVTERLGVGLHTFEIGVPPRLLAPTTYVVSVVSYLQFGGTIEHRPSCCEFTLTELANVIHQSQGVLGVQLPWNHRHSPAEHASAPGNWDGVADSLILNNQ